MILMLVLQLEMIKNYCQRSRFVADATVDNVMFVYYAPQRCYCVVWASAIIAAAWLRHKTD